MTTALQCPFSAWAQRTPKHVHEDSSLRVVLDHESRILFQIADHLEDGVLAARLPETKDVVPGTDGGAIAYGPSSVFIARGNPNLSLFSKVYITSCGHCHVLARDAVFMRLDDESAERILLEVPDATLEKSVVSMPFTACLQCSHRF